MENEEVPKTETIRSLATQLAEVGKQRQQIAKEELEYEYVETKKLRGFDIQ